MTNITTTMTTIRDKIDWDAADERDRRDKTIRDEARTETEREQRREEAQRKPQAGNALCSTALWRKPG